MSDEERDPLEELDEVLAGCVTHHTNGTSTLKLEFELTFGSEVKTELVVRRPTAKQMRQVKGDKPTQSEMLGWASDLTGLTPNQIDMIDILDTTRLLALMGRAFMAGPGTGAG